MELYPLDATQPMAFHHFRSDMLSSDPLHEAFVARHESGRQPRGKTTSDTRRKKKKSSSTAAAATTTAAPINADPPPNPIETETAESGPAIPVAASGKAAETIQALQQDPVAPRTSAASAQHLRNIHRRQASDDMTDDDLDAIRRRPPFIRRANANKQADKTSTRTAAVEGFTSDSSVHTVVERFTPPDYSHLPPKHAAPMFTRGPPSAAREGFAAAAPAVPTFSSRITRQQYMFNDDATALLQSSVPSDAREAASGLWSTHAAPYTSTDAGHSEPPSSMMSKLNQILAIVETQQTARTENVVEEVAMYSLVGLFVIFVVDAFTFVSRRYVR